MKRRSFLTTVAAAATIAVAPQALTRDWKTPVRYPDPDIKVLDPRFEKYRLGIRLSSDYILVPCGQKVLVGLVTVASCFGVIFPTIVLCVGWQIQAKLAFFGNRLIIPMDIPATGKDD